MKVLVACEESGVVLDAFTALGHDAMSCDLMPTDRPGPHYQGDIFDVLYEDWDLMVAHPPCTYLANSSSKHLYNGMKRGGGANLDRWAKLYDGAEFFRRLWLADIPKVAIENPIMLGYAKKIISASQTQIIQPWQFGHGETKATALWLRGLPPLTPTDIVEGRVARVHLMSPGPERQKLRSRTLPGIAEAMANQWGGRND